jgi:hypothetical protein
MEKYGPAYEGLLSHVKSELYPEDLRSPQEVLKKGKANWFDNLTTAAAQVAERYLMVVALISKTVMRKEKMSKSLLEKTM